MYFPLPFSNVLLFLASTVVGLTIEHFLSAAISISSVSEMKSLGQINPLILLYYNFRASLVEAFLFLTLPNLGSS